jgi:hypothetical protein
VYSSVDTHVDLHIDTVPKTGHDEFDASLKVVPTRNVIISHDIFSRAMLGSTHVPGRSSLFGAGGIVSTIVAECAFVQAVSLL